MEEKQKKILQWVFTGIMIVGLVLVIVGMFLNIVQSEELKLTYKLVGDKKWDMHEELVNEVNENWGKANGNYKFSTYNISSTFAVISFVVAIVGTVLLILNSVLKNVLHKNIKVLGGLAVFITIVGATLIIVAGMTLANNLGKVYWHGLDPEMKLYNSDPDFFSAAAGIYVGLVGGILAAVAGIISGLKAFKD